MLRVQHVLDQTLYLQQKDEYELASGILEGLLYNLVHVRQVQSFPAQESSTPVWSRDKYKWAKAGNLDNFHVDWYIPSDNELSAVRRILQRYLQPSLDSLTQLSKKEFDLDKETVLRNIRQVYRIVYGSSELLAPIPTNNCLDNSGICDAEMEKCSPSTVDTIERLIISLDKQNVRQRVLQVHMKI